MEYHKLQLTILVCISTYCVYNSCLFIFQMHEYNIPSHLLVLKWLKASILIYCTNLASRFLSPWSTGGHVEVCYMITYCKKILTYASARTRRHRRPPECRMVGSLQAGGKKYFYVREGFLYSIPRNLILYG